jgi:phosphate transport system substrate-binding protein
MAIRTLLLPATVAATATLLLALQAAPAQAQVVRIDGSSTVYPITEGVAEDFQKAERGRIKVTVGISGTGGGFKKFCRGEVDIQSASRPIMDKEMSDCRAAGIAYVELPIAFDAITVVVHPRNTWLKSITVAELKAIWEPSAQGRVTRWRQVNPAWPDAPIKLFGAGADSGTFDYFTEAIVGRAKASRGDFTASEDDNVLVQGVAQDVNAIGYFGYAYYAENQRRVRSVPIVAGPNKQAVAPSEKTVMDGSYQPLSRPVMIYVSAKALSRPEVKRFAQYYLAEVTRIAREVKYVPLGEGDYKLLREHLARPKLGTVFGGHHEVGVTIGEALRRPAKL